jgi:hypothetical protein
MASAARLPSLPDAETAYLERIVAILQQHLGDRLVGVYLFGSGAYGDYVPGVSDLDVQAVVAKAMPKQERRHLARALSHAVLPCPARRLEFVCYARSAIDPATQHPRFDMNFNTGAGEADHLSLDPDEEPSHWFLTDIAVARDKGQALIGPPPGQVFAPIPRSWRLEAIADGLVWHRDHEPTSANTVLNACRGWQYAVTGTSGSKQAGGTWARRHVRCPDIVDQAMSRRPAGPHFEASEVAAIVEQAHEAVKAAIRLERSRRSS